MRALPPAISTVILSFNRRDALRRTLREIGGQAWSRNAQIIVVDNASTDGSAAMVRTEFPGVELVALERNVILEGFNIGASRATGELLLVLDDDSWPQEGAVEAAAACMLADPTVGGLMLHRRHPRTLAFEWPFEASSLQGLQRRWPDMGCGNLFRRAAWDRVGGYETGYTLYRNDTDMALKLLAAGFDVVFDPAWMVWHDSVIASRKSDRWLRLSTRNWMWMARRHARGLLRLRGQVLGWLHAHRLAGLRPLGHVATLRGMLEGAFRSPPPLPPGIDPSRGEAYRRLLTLKMRLRR
ncbi:MAG: glycosyltransferase [Phycisphaerae bacterium]